MAEIIELSALRAERNPLPVEEPSPEEKAAERNIRNRLHVARFIYIGLTLIAIAALIGRGISGLA